MLSLTLNAKSRKKLWNSHEVIHLLTRLKIFDDKQEDIVHNKKRPQNDDFGESPLGRATFTPLFELTVCFANWNLLPAFLR